MKNTSELNSSIEKICRLCAMQQDKGQALFVEGSAELDKLVINICCLLEVECSDNGLHPKWICSGCQMKARSTEHFIQLVKTGQAKLKELFSDCHEDMKTKRFTETEALITHDAAGGSADNVQNLEMNKSKRCTKYKKRIKQIRKVDCFEQQAKELVRSKRLRRRPRRLLEEIELKLSAKTLWNASPLIVETVNEIDSCALITSQPIAELRTAAGNALGEMVEVEHSKDKENSLSTRTYFICEYCKAAFPRQNAFLKHIETHKNCSYECNECLEGFANKTLFSQHQALTGHVGVGIIEDNGAEKELLPRDKVHSQLSGTTATAAINIVVGENGQITSIDEMASSGMDKANSLPVMVGGVISTEDNCKISHNGCDKKLTNSKYACLACSKTFDYPYAARRHFNLVHKSERRHQCPQCPAAFKTKYNFDLHLATHTGKKNFSCNFCPKLFKSKHEWKVHNRIHTGEKPFKCLFCSKTFANLCNLVTHKRLHTGERPYKCSNCEAGFTSISHLKKHNEMHLRTAQRKLKIVPEAGASQKSSTKVKDINLCPNTDNTKALVKLNSIAEKPQSLLKPRNSNTKSLESKDLCSELLTDVTDVQVLPAITTNSDLNELSASCIKSSQIIDLYPELPSIANVQMLPAVIPNSYQSSTNTSISHSSKIVQKNRTATIPVTSAPAQFKFQCSSCQKLFKQSSALSKHQRTHTGERPYKCPMCPKTFADPSNFKKHRILHKNATHALKNVHASKSSTMQELRQMLEEQSVTITSHAGHSSTYAASDPDPDGLDTFSRSLPCASDFADADEPLNEHNSSFSATLGNFMSWNRFDNALPLAETSVNSLMPFTVSADIESSLSATGSSNQLVCVSYQDPVNPIGKTTTYYVIN